MFKGKNKKENIPKEKSFNKTASRLYKFCLKIAKTEAFKYVFFGVLTTVVSIVVYWLCSNALSVDGKISAFAVIVANVISWIFAATFAYITNKLFVFKSYNLNKDFLIKEAAAFYSARIFSLIVENAWLLVALEALAMDKMIAKYIGQIIVFVLNYALSKLFIFKKEKKNGKNV